MSLIFNDSNFVQNVQEEGKIKQYVFYYSENIQKFTIENAVKIVVHCWGGGGGGGGSTVQNTFVVSGAGGGGSFTILDFPFYPFKDYYEIEVIVGKGGKGGYFSNNNYIDAENGGDTIVRFLDRNKRIQKEFVSYGGKGGKGNAVNFVQGGDGGMNTLTPNNPLMGANYVGDSVLRGPLGGNEDQPYGDHCQMNYLSVSGSGGGSNKGITGYSNDGGSFIMNAGGIGNENGTRAGGGGSTYYGKGGDGGVLYNGTGQQNFKGQDGEPNSGAGGGGSISKILNSSSAQSLITSNVSGGNGANGLAVIEVYY